MGKRCRQAVTGRMCRWPLDVKRRLASLAQTSHQASWNCGETQTSLVMVSEGREDVRLKVLVRMAVGTAAVDGKAAKAFLKNTQTFFDAEIST